MMDTCLAGLPTDRILACTDDIVIFNNTLEEHLRDLKSVFECLRTTNVTLKASKCVFAAAKVDYLGYDLSAEGIKPQDWLTKAVEEFKRPETKKGSGAVIAIDLVL